MKNSSGAILDIVRSSGRKPVFITETVKQKIENDVDINGEEISIISSIVRNFNESFQYDFVEYKDLLPNEKAVFNTVDKILAETHTHITKEQIHISNYLQPDFPEESFGGVWEPIEGRIIIHRQMLSDKNTFAGVLIHELTHAGSGYGDVSRAFETELTKWIGYFAMKAMQN